MSTRIRSALAVATALVAFALQVRADVSVSPSGKTDGTDSANIRAAIAALPEEGGRIRFADGVYYITEAITLNGAIELVGNDADRSKVVIDAQNTDKVRLVRLTNAKAFVHGFRLQNAWSSEGGSGVYYHGMVYLEGGMVSNCTVKMSKPSKFCGGVGMSGGTIVDCDITGCGSTDGGNARIGGGLRLFGATCVADRLTITNNIGKAGSGVYLNASGARLINSLVAGNSAGADAGGGIYAVAGSIVSNCVVRGNTGGDGAGIYGGCDVIDSLVVGNVSTASGGGFYKTAGTMRGCTVAGNTAAVKGSGVYQTKGSIQDSVLWNNGSACYLTLEDSLALAGGTCTYTCAAQAGSGEGNITDRIPAFVDPANGDYRLAAVSPCRGAGKDGVDMGCFAYSAATSPRAAFTYVIVDGKAPATTTFSATVEGAEATGYVWNFGDGSMTEETSGATAEHTYAAAGRYAVTLTVKTAGGDLVYTVPNAVNLGSDVVYVSKTGSNTFPYADWATAATDIQTAVDRVICSDEKPGKVMIADDTYTITKVVTLDKAVELSGNDADRSKVALDANNKDGVHLLYVRYARAFAHGLTFRNAFSSSDKFPNYCTGPIYITAGMVSNCTVRMNSDKRSRFCGGVGMTGGTIVDCDISGCGSTDGNIARYGGGLRLYGATCVADRLVVSNNNNQSGSGVYLQTKGAKLINSLIVGNDAKTYAGGGILGVAGTIVSNCVVCGNTGASGGGISGPCDVYDTLIVSNSVTGAGGGVSLSGGKLVRCRVAACTAGTTGGGVYQTDGTVDHSTIVLCNALSSGSGIYQTKGTVKNTILSDNGNLTGYSLSDYIATGGTVTYSRAREFTGERQDGNMADPPLFRDLLGLDLRLFSMSPCRGAAEDGTDMGAIPWVYDPEEPVEIVISVSTDGSLNPVTATFACQITGELPAAVTNYVWQFGDGTSATAETNGIVHVYARPGVYSTTLTLQLADGTVREAQKKDAVQVYSDVSWVDAANPNPEPPYDTEAKAANTILEALNAVYVPDGGFGTVKVKAGRYALEADTTHKIARAVHIVSASGERDVFLDGRQNVIRFLVQDKDALVSGLAVTNALAGSQVWGVFDIAAGVVSNCAVAHVFNPATSCYTGGARVEGADAKLVDCRFEDCKSTDVGYGGFHSIGGIYLNGGLVDGCLVTNCMGRNAGGIQINGGTVRRSTVTGCGNGSSIRQLGGLVEGCRIVGNKSPADGCAGITLNGGAAVELRNCLVSDNSSAEGSAGISIGETGATVENCTVVGNVGKTYAGLISGGAAATWINTLSWDNRNAEGAQNPDLASVGTFDHCLLGTDPRFRHPKRGDYRVKNDSPARDTGVERNWMAGATDLLGNPRIFNGKPDIGCIESEFAPGMLLMLR